MLFILLHSCSEGLLVVEEEAFQDISVLQVLDVRLRNLIEWSPEDHLVTPFSRATSIMDIVLWLEVYRVHHGLPSPHSRGCTSHIFSITSLISTGVACMYRFVGDRSRCIA